MEAEITECRSRTAVPTSPCLASDKLIKTHTEELHFHWDGDIHALMEIKLTTARFRKKRKAGVCLPLPQNWGSGNLRQDPLIISDENIGIQFTKEDRKCDGKEPKAGKTHLNY